MLTFVSRFLPSVMMSGCLSLVLSAPASGALLAFYDFDGDANDRSGNEVHPTTQTNVTQVAGFEGQGYEFNGSNSYIQIPLNINAASHPALTMGAWVKSDVATTGRQVISQDNGGFDRSLGIDSRGGGVGWSAFSGSGSVLGYEPVTTGAWTFVAVSYDQVSLTAKLYVNGNSYTEAANLGNGNTFTRIGSNPAFGEYFDGVIDNVFFFDEVLSPSRIEGIRLNGASAIPEPTAAVLGVFSLSMLARRRRQG